MCPSTTVALELKGLAIQLFGAQANPRGRPRQCVCEGIGNSVRNRQYLGAHLSRDAEMWDAEVVVVWCHIAVPDVQSTTYFHEM